MSDYYVIANGWLILVVAFACAMPGLFLLWFVEMGRSQRYWNRINRALAAYNARRLFAPHRQWQIVDEMVKALRGEK